MPNDVEQYIRGWGSLNDREERALTSAILKSLLESGTLGQRHPLGFVVFRIQSDAGVLRLHVWPPDDRDVQDEGLRIHDHTFELKSRIVCGELINIRYSSVETAHGDLERYVVTYDGDASTIQSSGVLVRVSELGRELFTQGAQYVLPPFVLHDTYTDPGALIATLVVPNPAEGGVATVLGPPKTGTRRFSRRYLSANTSGALVSAVLARLPINAAI